MADRKVSQLTSLSSASPEDLLLAVDDPNGTPTSKKITVKALFGTVSTNTAFTANTTYTGNRALFAANAQFTKSLRANTVIMTFGSAPSNNNATSQSMEVGQIRFTNTHLYIAVNATSIKRVALSTF